MRGKITKIAASVKEMDTQLRNDLFPSKGQWQKKLWENTYIKHQIDKRNKGGGFSINDHIRAMVYAMLSSGASWARLENGIDLKSGKIVPLDKCFHEYDPDYIKSRTPQRLKCDICKLGYASQYTGAQMEALPSNVERLLSLQREHGSMEVFYQGFFETDDTGKTLVKQLSKDFLQFGPALTAEYLRNMGYDMAKPDRHIRRILGSNHLACSDKELVPIYEAFDLVREIATKAKRPTAEVDYILWSYCAKGFGEICTATKPKCSACVARKICGNIGGTT